MAMIKENTYGGDAFIGYKTLFVNSAPTQVLAHKMGLPPNSPILYRAELFDAAVNNPIFNGTVTNDNIIKSDLVRYNLGKFFWRASDLYAASFGENYFFVHSDPVTPLSAVDSGAPFGDSSIFSPVVASYIGHEAEVGAYGKSNYKDKDVDWIQKGGDLDDFENLDFSSKTYIAIRISDGDFVAAKGLGYITKGFFPHDGSPFARHAFEYFLSQGAPGPTYSSDWIASPQFLGLGPRAKYNNSPGQRLSPPFGPDGTDKTRYYLDHAFIYAHPYSKNTRDDLGNVKVFYTDIEPNYNFYQEIYENSLKPFISVSTPWQKELYLPNFNVVLAESKTHVPEEFKIYSVLLALPGISHGLGDIAVQTNKNYLIHSTLNGKVPIDILRPLEIKSNKYDEVQGRSGNEYLDTWGSVLKPQMNMVVNDVDLAETVGKFRNIIYPLGALKNDDINISKASFPFYNEITFNTDTTNQMAGILRNAKLFDLLILDYINERETTGEKIKDIKFHSYQELELSPGIEASEMGPGAPVLVGGLGAAAQFPLNTEGTSYKTYDFDAFATSIKTMNAEGSETFGDIFDGEVQNKVISVSGEDFGDQDIEFFKNDPFTQLIYKITFSSLYADFVKKHCRTYKDIAAGKLAYSETLFYRIEKRNKQGEFIQNFWILNDSQLDEVNLIDTQIFYGTEYTYEIFAIQLVLGNKYWYTKGIAGTEAMGNPYVTNVANWSHYVFSMIAEAEQSIKLIEVPYTTPKTVQVQEAPPVPPNIDFIPFRQKDNQILIALNVGVDEYYDKYIPILPEDEEILANSAIVNSKGQTYFKSEGDATSFELFRISENQMPAGPSSYQDFGNPNLAKRVTLSRKHGDPTYVDDILPNTKYWYIFRTNDAKHDPLDPAPDFSNPTNVFEVQMINNTNAIYPIINTYDVNFFDQQALMMEKNSSKSMRKYLYIQPAFEQRTINADPEEGGTDFYDPAILPSMKYYVEEELQNNVSGLKLGYAKESIWSSDIPESDTNNRFKIRLTSKKTGRKVDIFLRFKKPILEK